MLESIITIVIISSIITFMFNSKDNVTESDDLVVWSFSKNFKLIMMICTVFFIVISAVSFIILLFNKDQNLLGIGVFMSLLSFCCSFVYLIIRNKKIIYENSALYSFNILGKMQKFYLQDISEAIEYPSDCMKLIFKNGKKISIDMQMNNYFKIKDILEKNNITYKDKNGNVAPKGW